MQVTTRLYYRFRVECNIIYFPSLVKNETSCACQLHAEFSLKVKTEAVGSCQDKPVVHKAAATSHTICLNHGQPGSCIGNVPIYYPVLKKIFLETFLILPNTEFYSGNKYCIGILS
jgi:hypothetical protein